MIQKYQILKKKNTDHNHDKYITSPESINLAAEALTARFAQSTLLKKVDFDTKLQELNKKDNSGKTKHLLVETEFEEIEKLDAAYFKSKSFFDDDGIKTCLLFQPM